ncbi:MAG: hypothetical protein IPG04_35745 [Polyangiaceae bacterium]|jgi:hypothetical protein|nr:hypothetical protein [Polyangiaceae bacterium]
MRRLRLALLPLLSIASACVDDSYGYASGFLDTTQTAVTFTLRGDDPVMRIDALIFIDAYGEGEIQIDSAKVTALVDGETTVYENPEIESEDFPLAASDFESSLARLVLEVPSPVTDSDTFDGFCRVTARTVTLDINFYAPQNDNGTGDPPLFTATGTLPLVPGGTPPAIDTFASSGPMKIPSQFLGIEQKLRLEPLAADEAMLIVQSSTPDVGNFIAGSYTFYLADSDSVGAFTTDGGNFFQMPRVSPKPDGGTLIGGRGGLQVVNLVSVDASGIPQLYGYLEVDASAAPEYEALSVAAIGRSETGHTLAVQSAYPLLGPEGAVAPLGDKYYGSFLVEVGPDLTVSSVEARDRDVVFIERFEDGSRLIATTDLPPREASPTLRIERFDPAGDPVFSHEEPALVFEPVIRPLSDGGVLFAYEEEQPGGRVEVVRLAADGSEVFRWVGVGFDPSVAAKPDGGAYVTMVGSVPGIDAPARSLPLLLELSAEGEVTRGAQLACGGSASITSTPDGTALLAGAFLENMTIGGTVMSSVPGDIIVAPVE